MDQRKFSKHARLSRAQFVFVPRIKYKNAVRELAPALFWANRD
jgi:hypothetical protein